MQSYENISSLDIIDTYPHNVIGLDFKQLGACYPCNHGYPQWLKLVEFHIPICLMITILCKNLIRMETTFIVIIATLLWIFLGLLINSLFSLIDSCLEEGAEEFLLKPVKLSDVRRLRDFIMRGEVKDGEKISQKRRRSDECSPALSNTFSPKSHPCDPSSVLSPLSPSNLPSKKSRLWSEID